MRFRDAFIHTLRDDPADAEVVSHRLMLRAGLISKVAAGIYNYLPLGWRSLAKLETIIREELDRIGCAELVMPAVQPAQLWVESGRWAEYGPELLRLEDRGGREFCVGPTHEEVITDIVRRTVSSYRQLPVSLYQIQTKFRDEIRPRFGLMRGREFIMKDAYSFHATAEDLEATYRDFESAYDRIFRRCGLEFTKVEADTGNIGGSESHEFMVTAATGEDVVLSCACGYGANIEKATTGELPAAPAWPRDESEPTRVDTPEQRSVDEVAAFLGVDPAHLIKTLVFRWASSDAEGLAVALIRGDREVSEVKLKNALDVAHVELASPEEIQALTGGPQGFSGPVGLEGARMLADPSVMALDTAATGANAADAHLVGVRPGTDFEADAEADLDTAQEGDPCPRCGEALALSRGIEVGHIFKLGTKYSVPMRATFLDAEGDEIPMIMGCYGLGVGRTVAAAIEQNHDEQGIIWPLPLAPYAVELILLNADKPDVAEAAGRIYDDLRSAGVEVLFDDRDERPGVKFNDMDLLGIPVRVVVGARGVKNGECELSLRRDGERLSTPLGDAVAEVRRQLDLLAAEIRVD